MGMDKSGSVGAKKNDNNATEIPGGECPDENDNNNNADESPSETGLAQTLEDVDRFLESLSEAQDSPPSEAPASVEVLLTSVERMIGDGDESNSEEASFLAAVRRVSDLSKRLGRFSADLDPVFNRASLVLQKAMSFLEEEFTGLLEDPPAERVECNADRCVLVPAAEQENRPISAERAAAIAAAMVSAGYAAECEVAYGAARRSSVRAAVEKAGFEGASADEVQKMAWEALGREIETWIAAARACSSEIFPAERWLCAAVFPDELRRGAMEGLLKSAAVRLLGFAEAVVLTKRSTDKVFKLLDMYEALRDLERAVGDGDVAAEVALVKARVGEAAAGSFCELENSIKYEQGRTPVPSGAVHPATRYVMNYLEFACAYKDTLDEVFQGTHTAFPNQVEAVMEVLDANLQAKSKLYRDQSLNHIFMMNNGRYIVQKIKASAEIHQLMGDAWCRRRSSELRQHHKNYQRESWGKVLQCLAHDGLQAASGGKVSKPVLKERFKTFNAMFEEIHKTQTAWVVSDEQLQSELRVSISAVMIPAYRSFLGRFKHCLDSGRQTEKYIKYQPEDIETMIDDLFDGNPASLLRKRNTNN